MQSLCAADIMLWRPCTDGKTFPEIVFPYNISCMWCQDDALLPVTGILANVLLDGRCQKRCPAIILLISSLYCLESLFPETAPAVAIAS